MKHIAGGVLKNSRRVKFVTFEVGIHINIRGTDQEETDFDP